MAMDGLPEVVPPSGRVPGQLLLAATILKRWRRRYRKEMEKGNSILGVSSGGLNIGERGHRGGPPWIQKGPWHASPLAAPPGRLVVALWSHFGFSGSFGRGDFLSIFSRIFWALLIAGKPEIQN